MTDMNLPAKLRAQIMDAIVAALHRALASYTKHTAGIARAPDDKFYESHKNARMALSHMELLIKLAKGLGVRDPVIEQAELTCKQEAYDE